MPKDYVVGGEIIAVRPLQAFAQMHGQAHAVLRLFHAGGHVGEEAGVGGIVDQQPHGRVFCELRIGAGAFKEADQVLRKQEQPFFAIIQTSGNHRPYTIPEDNHGFELIQHDDKSLKDAGFSSNGEYNSFRFMDHSVGYFMQLAKQSGYFDNTIFIFYGDHGITGYGGKHTPQFESDYILTGFHTPLLFYAPKLITQPSVNHSPASEVDLLPTIAGLAAPNGYVNTTLGRDLRDPQFADRRYAFTIFHRQIPEIGLIGEETYFRMNADGSKKTLIDTHANDAGRDVLQQQPGVARRMEELTTAIHETAKYMLYHNKH